MTLNQRLFVSRDSRVLDSFEKQQRSWHTLAENLNRVRTLRNAAPGTTVLGRHVNFEQSKRDMSLLERLELHQQQLNTLELISIA